MRRLRRRRSLKLATHEGGWTLGLAVGATAAYWIAMAARDGSLAVRLSTSLAAWSFAAGGALLLLVMAQGWPRFAGGFCPAAGTGAVIAGVLDRTTPHVSVSLLPPLLALAGVAIAATIQAIAWEQAVRTGRRS